MNRWSRETRWLSGCVLLLGIESTSRAADVLTQHNDNSRTGANTAETTLTPGNVTPDKFGKLWTLYTDGQVVAQPLYVSNLAVDAPGPPAVKGTFNAVIVATMHNQKAIPRLRTTLTTAARAVPAQFRN